MDVWTESESTNARSPTNVSTIVLLKCQSALSQKVGDAIPTACQDWAATKAAYRFFSNPGVDKSIILTGHFAATRSREAQTEVSGSRPARYE